MSIMIHIREKESINHPQLHQPGYNSATRLGQRKPTSPHHQTVCTSTQQDCAFWESPSQNQKEGGDWPDMRTIHDIEWEAGGTCLILMQTDYTQIGVVRTSISFLLYSMSVSKSPESRVRSEEERWKIIGEEKRRDSFCFISSSSSSSCRFILSASASHGLWSVRYQDKKELTDNSTQESILESCDRLLHWRV